MIKFNTFGSILLIAALCAFLLLYFNSFPSSVPIASTNNLNTVPARTPPMSQMKAKDGAPEMTIDGKPAASYILIFKSGFTEAQREAVKQRLIKEYGAIIMHTYDTLMEGFSFRVLASDAPKAVDAFGQLEEVDYIEANQVVSIPQPIIK